MHLGSSLSQSISSSFTRCWGRRYGFCSSCLYRLSATRSPHRRTGRGTPAPTPATRPNATPIAKPIPFVGPKGATNPRSPDAARGTPQIFDPRPPQSRSTVWFTFPCMNVLCAMSRYTSWTRSCSTKPICRPSYRSLRSSTSTRAPALPVGNAGKAGIPSRPPMPWAPPATLSALSS